MPLVRAADSEVAGAVDYSRGLRCGGLRDWGVRMRQVNPAVVVVVGVIVVLGLGAVLMALTTGCGGGNGDGLFGEETIADRDGVCISRGCAYYDTVLDECECYDKGDEDEDDDNDYPTGPGGSHQRRDRRR